MSLFTSISFETQSSSSGTHLPSRYSNRRRAKSSHDYDDYAYQFIHNLRVQFSVRAPLFTL